MTLLGDVTANLCVECRTEWGGFLVTQPAWQDVLANDAREAHLRSLALAQQPPPEADWLDLVQRKGKAEAEARALALEFVKPLPAATERSNH